MTRPRATMRVTWRKRRLICMADDRFRLAEADGDANRAKAAKGAAA
jgi:hypothetical protein